MTGHHQNWERHLGIVTTGINVKLTYANGSVMNINARDARRISLIVVALRSDLFPSCNIFPWTGGYSLLRRWQENQATASSMSDVVTFIFWEVAVPQSIRFEYFQLQAIRSYCANRALIIINYFHERSTFLKILLIHKKSLAILLSSMSELQPKLFVDRTTCLSWSF